MNIAEKQSTPWFVYMIECQNGSLYTGAARDVRTRYLAHLSGAGARYTKMHRPYCLRLVIECDSKISALKLEYVIKQYSSKQKWMLCEQHESVEPVQWFEVYPESNR